MKLHTSTLTSSDILDALRVTGLTARGVSLDWDRYAQRGSRSRSHRFDVYLVAERGYGRRYANSGTRGAGYDMAALYDEWGAFLAELFHRDGNLIAGPYDGVDGFLMNAAARRSRKLPGAAPVTLDGWRKLYIDEEEN